MLLKIFLYPFAALYDGITRFRNHLYDIGHTPSFEFETFVISIGNLSVGGTGKTPMAEYLIRLLTDSKNVTTLSRGYGRKTKGLRFASTHDSAATLGDEPFQFYLKFKEKINVTVAEDRAFAIPHILHEYPDTEIILMDDAYQHRSVRPQLSVLLTDYWNPFYSDMVLPAGRLREARSGAKRADVLVVTKCPPNLDEATRNRIATEAQKYAPGKPVFFGAIKYAAPIPFGKPVELTKQVILVTGIAKAETLIAYVEANFTLIKHFYFTDHHSYTKNDLTKILEVQKKAGAEVCIVTTEKDMTKLIDAQFKDYISSAPWYYLPMESYFLKDGQKFDDFISDSIVNSRLAVRN